MDEYLRINHHQLNQAKKEDKVFLAQIIEQKINKYYKHFGQPKTNTQLTLWK